MKLLPAGKDGLGVVVVGRRRQSTNSKVLLCCGRLTSEFEPSPPSPFPLLDLTATHAFEPLQTSGLRWSWTAVARLKKKQKCSYCSRPEAK